MTTKEVDITIRVVTSVDTDCEAMTEAVVHLLSTDPEDVCPMIETIDGWTWKDAS
jgi:hypothetical protein